MRYAYVLVGLEDLRRLTMQLGTVDEDAFYVRRLAS